MRERRGGTILTPLYDNEDSVCGIIWDGAPFYFQKNLQGDIIGIVNANAELVARYSYDAWGVPTILSDTSNCAIATVNPFRYRGYYYDVETGWYYLQSRYYDPVVGRFINGDDPQAVIAENLGSIGYNLFCCCQNNPVNGKDVDGHAFVQVFAKIILGIILGIFSQLVFDVINYLLSLIANPKASFEADPRDYILSILSSILAFFDIRNKWIRLGVGLLQIVLSYIGKQNDNLWRNIAIDVMFFIVGEIIGGALNRTKTKQIKNAREKIYKNKKKLSKALVTARRYAETPIKEHFAALGIVITFSLNISSKLVNSLANILIK